VALKINSPSLNARRADEHAELLETARHDPAAGRCELAGQHEALLDAARHFLALYRQEGPNAIAEEGYLPGSHKRKAHFLGPS
jgi:hypothetical protein